MAFSLSLLIPAHNEEKTIEKLLEENLKILLKKKQMGVINDFEIIVLNDGSSDRTGKILLKYQNNPHLSILENVEPTGIENAFNLLYSKVKMDWYLLVPGDAQWPPESTQIMLETLSVQIDCAGIMGIRTNKKEIYSKNRRLISWGYSILANAVLGIKCSDPGSIKLLPRQVTLIAKSTKGMATEIESMLIAQRLENKKISVVPVPWTMRQFGNESGSSLKHVLKTVLYVPFLFFLKLKG